MSLNYTYTTKVSTGFSIFTDSFKILKKYPILFFPMFINWILYSLVTLYFSFCFNWQNLNLEQTFLLIFAIILTFCIILSTGSLIMLEIIQQIETGYKIDFKKAINDTLSRDFFSALPIMFVWAFIWFILEILTMIFSKQNKNNSNNSNNSFSANAVANTLGGYSNFSLWNLSMSLIKSGVRLIVFFIYPAIAWENEGCINAIKKGFSGIKNNITEFATGFISIELAVSLIFLPPGVIFYLSSELDLNFSTTVWVLTILYIAIATSLYLYVQQMFAAILYMWNMKWVREVKRCKRANEPIPTLKDIKKPNLLDNIPDLKFR